MMVNRIPLVRPEQQSWFHRFVPHIFRTQRRPLRERSVRIRIERNVFDDMMIIVAEAETEVGWLGTVTRKDDLFIIEGGIFLPGQVVSGSVCRITKDGYSALIEEFYSSDREPEEVDELLGRMLFWGHSHVNIPVDASGQDERQMKLFVEGRDTNDLPFFIRGIFNKKGEAKFSVFDYQANEAFDDVPWDVVEQVDDARRAHWRGVLQKNIGHMPVQQPQPRPQPRPNWQGGDRQTLTSLPVQLAPHIQGSPLQSAGVDLEQDDVGEGLMDLTDEPLLDDSGAESVEAFQGRSDGRGGIR